MNKKQQITNNEQQTAISTTTNNKQQYQHKDIKQQTAISTSSKQSSKRTGRRHVGMSVSRCFCLCFVDKQLITIDGFCLLKNNDDDGHCCYDCHRDQQQTINTRMIHARA